MDNSDFKRVVIGSISGREHCCKWTGCKRQVPAKMWGCIDHWSLLPLSIQNLILRNYRPGQEKTGVITRGYLEAARTVEKWIKENGN